MMMMSIKGGYLIFIILLIGLNHLRADEDITEAISDTTDAITTQSYETETYDSTDESLRDNDAEEEEEEVKNPTVQRLPADSETIRKNIIDSEFNCEEKEPGYYADIENECQIFHRCLEGRNEVYSFICPETTRFDQRVLVCIWEDYYDFDCSQSERYYRESNRAFLGNITAEESLNENIKSSQEIKIVEVLEHTDNPSKEEIKLYELIPTEELSMTDENAEASMIEENSIEEAEKNSIDEEDEKEVESVSEEVTEESNDYQAELIPSSTNHIDASIATSDISDSTSSFDVDSIEIPPVPQKIISLSVLDPIVEMMPNVQESETTMRNIRKRSGSHRKRFLFKADAH